MEEKLKKKLSGLELSNNLELKKDKANKMRLSELKKAELKQAQKALKFLEILSKNLKILKFKNTYGFVIEPGKVSYFDIETSTYKLYDYTEFNSVMCSTYYDVAIASKLNQLFLDFKSNMDTVYVNSKYYFYDNIYTTFHLVSWFIRSLRYSKLGENQFDTDELIKNFPFPFLEKSADIDENIVFIIDFINLLQEKKIIKIIDLKISFTNYDSLKEILNFSFENLIFGGNLNTDKCIIISEHLDISVLNDNSVSEDYKFNYIVSFATNYISYDNCSNNLFVQNIKCQV